MRILFVLDHPYTIEASEDVPHQRSFSAAVARAAMRGARRAGHDVDLIDLVADGFNPTMSRADLVAWRLKAAVDPQVLDYQHRLLAADHLVFVFPLWWEAMPASTKGFLDRVLVKGVMYEELPNARGNPFRNLMTRLAGVTVMSVMTTPDKVYRWWYGDPLTKILFKGTFGKIGVKHLKWMNFASVTEVGAEKRAKMLHDAEERFATMARCPTHRASVATTRQL